MIEQIKIRRSGKDLAFQFSGKNSAFHRIAMDRFKALEVKSQNELAIIVEDNTILIDCDDAPGLAFSASKQLDKAFTKNGIRYGLQGLAVIVLMLVAVAEMNYLLAEPRPSQSNQHQIASSEELPSGCAAIVETLREDFERKKRQRSQATGYSHFGLGKN